MSAFPWTNCQQAALQAFTGLYVSPAERFLVIRGHGGTGKSTVLKHFIDSRDNLDKTRAVLLGHNNFTDYEIMVTATTNKAVEALRDVMGPFTPVYTTASALKLRLVGHGKQAHLTATNGARGWLQNTILVVDEASYMDEYMLQHILNALGNTSKLVLMGDPDQLLPPGCYEAPAFNQGYKETLLTEKVRFQNGSKIDLLSANFRTMVQTGQLFEFQPDGSEVIWLPRDQFEQEVVKEFTRPDWKPSDSRVLAWRNKEVSSYNQGLFSMGTGRVEYQAGDTVVCNTFVGADPDDGMSKTIRTDALVQITENKGRGVVCDLPGTVYGVGARRGDLFVPDSWEDAKRVMHTLAVAGNRSEHKRAQGTWADLRPLFASTVDKSQGSTFDRVFVDFDDIARCPHMGQLARMGYVATSRARKQIFLTGDL